MIGSLQFGNNVQSWNELLQLRKEIVQSRSVVHTDVKSALYKAVIMIQEILTEFALMGYEVHKAEPAHAKGHFVRDYAHAIVLLSDTKFGEADIIASIIATALHDVGCVLVPRYNEPNKALRHAEITALVVNKIMIKLKHDNEVRLKVVHGISAHTHYLTPEPSLLDSGEKVIRDLWPEYDAYGLPYPWVWYPRWIDRLENCGPTHVARHFLSLGESHPDFDGENFYVVDLETQLGITMRSNEEIKASGGKRNMLEHLLMYANSQNNNTPYGKNDAGIYLFLRDAQVRRIKDILRVGMQQPHQPTMERFNRWEAFCLTRIEPTELAGKDIKVIMQAVHALPPTHQRVWVNIFEETIVQYNDWAASMKTYLAQLPPSMRSLPGICDDIIEIIQPF